MGKQYDYSRHYLSVNKSNEDHLENIIDYNIQLIKNVLPEDKNAKILDVGCGRGYLLMTLKKLGYKNIQGVDVDKGQIEGARSLGMKSSETSFFVILPQAIRNALPTIGNELIVNIKDSSVLNVIATTELYYRIGKISVRTYAYLEGYALLAVIYLIMTLLAALVLKIIEKKLDGQKISLNPFARWKRSLL